MLEVHVGQESDLESCMAHEAGSILPLTIPASAMFARHYHIHIFIALHPGRFLTCRFEHCTA